MGAPVAIAVVSWNTRALLGACLESIHPEVEASRAEAWVVDNASGDGSPDLVRERFPWANLVASSENLGFGRAVNLVADRTDTAWIAAANADTELPPGALEALLEEGARDPATGALAPRLLRPDGSTQHSVYPFPTLPLTVAFNLGIPALSDRLADRLCLEGHWDPERPRRVDWAIGAFLVIRRAAWEEVGGFNPEQWMYAEDLDLGWRLARSGWATRYVPTAVVRHRPGAAVEQAWGPDTTPRWMASTYTWMLRRRGAAITRAVALVNVLGAGIRWALLSAGALAAPGRWAARRDEMRRWARLHLIGLRPRRALLRHR